MKKQDEIILLQSFPNIYLAEMVRGILESYGIICVLRKGDGEAASAYIGTVGDRDLLVLKRDYERAKRILRTYKRSKEEDE